MSDLNSITIERLKTLIEINTRINSHYGDINPLLVSILESVMSVVSCESSSLLLVQKEDNSLRFEVALGPKGAEVKQIKVDKRSIAGWVAQNNQSLIINDVSKDSRFNSSVQSKTNYISRNMIAVPMRINNECIGVIEIINKNENKDFTEDDLAILELLSKQAAIAYQNSEEYILQKIQINVLKNAAKAGPDYHTFIAKNPKIISLLKNISQAAKTNSSVLIIGESGVGKELFAEQVHLNSNRANKPFVRVSCAALNPSLLESELFGHVKGAFTDAVNNRKGRFEIADGGTLFLDEIGELPLDLQAKLLRVLQEKKFERVGSSETCSVDVRIIAATNRNLEEMVENGKFRADLYFRLNVLPLSIPPLRERKDEIPDFCEYFLAKFKNETHKNFDGFSESAKKVLCAYRWPGNVRELENTIERACIIGEPPLIQVGDLRLPVNEYENQSYDSMMIDDVELGSDKSLKNALNSFKKKYLIKILNECNWNQTKAAKILDVQRTYVSRLMNELGIKENHQ